MSDSDTKPNTISLEEHARKVKEGEVFVETLRDGSTVEFRVKPPKQGLAYIVQGVLQDIISKNPELIAMQETGGAGRLTDAGAILRFQELDGRCLMACVKEIDEDNVMFYSGQLDPDCALLKRVKELCGVGIFDLEEDSQGN